MTQQKSKLNKIIIMIPMLLMLLNFLNKKEIVLISSFWTGFFNSFKLINFDKFAISSEYGNSLLNGCLFSMGTILLLEFYPEQYRYLLHFAIMVNCLFSKWKRIKDNENMEKFKEIMNNYKIRNNKELIKIIESCLKEKNENLSFEKKKGIA